MDCTQDQESGVNWAFEKLRNGVKIHSVDLSDATNNIPLSQQLQMLKALGIEKRDIQLFKDLSRAEWVVNDPVTKRIRGMRWTVGQPQGLRGSFECLASWHGTTLEALYRG
jgi:hypothetical protein